MDPIVEFLLIVVPPFILVAIMITVNAYQNKQFRAKRLGLNKIAPPQKTVIDWFWQGYNSYPREEVS